MLVPLGFVHTKELERVGADDTRQGIRCPQCLWRPARTDRWYCDCGHAWNTFDTRGRCPNCQKQWTHTECLRCTGWSLHEAWYERDPDRS